MTAEERRRRTQTLFSLAGLTFLALMGNVCSLRLLPGVDVLFGGVFVLLAAWRFGPLAGVAVAVLSSAYTYSLWGHPWAIVTYMAEAFAVGMWRRRLDNLFLVDFLFWLTFGNALLLLLWKEVYNMGWDGTLFMILKCDVNSLFNALVAFCVVTLLPARNRVDPESPRRPPLDHLLLCGMLLLAVVPLLVVMLYDTLHMEGAIESSVNSRRAEALRLAQRRVTQWQTPLVRGLPLFAHATAGDYGVKREFSFPGTGIIGLRNAYLIDRDGATAKALLGGTTAPPEALFPQPVLDHLRLLRSSSVPEEAAFLLCPFGKEACRVFVAAAEGTSRHPESFVILEADPETFFEELGSQFRTLGVQALLTDDNTGAVLPVPFFPDYLLSRLEEFRDDTAPFPRRIAPGTNGRGGVPLAHLWTRTVLVDRVTYEAMPGWTMYLACPLDVSNGTIFGNYIRTMSLMVSMIFACIVVSIAMSRRIVRPILHLTTLTKGLSPEGPVEEWPRGVSAEVECLVTNVRRMHSSLMAQFTELQKLNRNLDNTVQIRTTELKETNRALEEEVAERARMEELLRISLQDKEVLLREVHHRVKNNLQIISSLLNLQAQRVRTPELAELLREGQNRVRAMALVHDLLYRTSEFATVDMKMYLEHLVGYFRETSLLHNAEVATVTRADAMVLSVDKAVPCGLVVGELFMNACKHGFPDSRRGTIAVSLQSHGNDAVLIVSNDGAPLREDYADRATGLGMTIVNALVRQLDGTLRVHAGPPVAFEVRFPQ